MTIELKDWLNSINYTKKNLLEGNPELVKSYPAYVINKCLSAHIDSILYANAMNEYYTLDLDMQYSFFLNSLRKGKRFSPWIKKENIEDLECISEYYNYSLEKASQVLKILTKEQISYIKQQLDKGGRR